MAGTAETRSDSSQQSAVTIAAPTGGYTKGTQVKTGNIVGYMAADVESLANGALVYRDPAVLMEKVTGAGTAFAVGDKVYFVAASGKVSPASTGNTLIGRCKEVASTSATQVLIDLEGTVQA